MFIKSTFFDLPKYDNVYPSKNLNLFFPASQRSNSTNKVNELMDTHSPDFSLFALKKTQQTCSISPFLFSFSATKKMLLSFAAGASVSPFCTQCCDRLLESKRLEVYFARQNSSSSSIRTEKLFAHIFLRKGKQRKNKAGRHAVAENSREKQQHFPTACKRVRSLEQRKQLCFSHYP